MRIQAARSFRGTFVMPGDKSITHRAFIFGSLAAGVTEVVGASWGEDCRSTRRCLTDLGVRFEDVSPDVIRIHGGRGLRASASRLDCGNSGTTIRLLMGVLAGTDFVSELAGDASLNGRPMERVAKPLRALGARIETSDGRPPVRVTGSRLLGASVAPEAASAQIKSAILLAALSAEGVTEVREPLASRDHTERMIPAFGGTCETRDGVIRMVGPQRLKATAVTVPGDPSSAAPFVVAALLLPDSETVIENVLLNPFRVRYLDVLREMGGDIHVDVTSQAGGETVGRIVARSSNLRGVSIAASEVPAIVDELPILAVAGAYASGRFEVRGASELRVKESDRIKAMVEGLTAMGARAAELEDGFTIEGGAPLAGAPVRSHADHRIAMALAVAALGARGDTVIEGADAVAISLPRFFPELARGALV